MINPTTPQQQAILKKIRSKAPKFTARLFVSMNQQYKSFEQLYYYLLSTL